MHRQYQSHQLSTQQRCAARVASHGKWKPGFINHRIAIREIHHAVYRKQIWRAAMV